VTSDLSLVVADENGTETYRGRALDLRETGLSAATVVDAIDPDTEYPASQSPDSTTADARPTLVRVDTPTPGRWWRTLANPTDATPPLDRVVAAARSRGHAPPELRRLAATERELTATSVEAVDVTATKRRLAETGAAVDRLREEAATIRGRLQARRSVDADTGDVEAALAETMRTLSEAETERLGAEQAHADAERAARRSRQNRRRRLRLQDRVSNRRRDARQALAASVDDAFERALDRFPGTARLRTDALGVEGDVVTAALAAGRVATLDAPVVVPGDRFGSEADAEDVAARLDCPVVLC
jgi:hypothetical protein